MLAYRPLVFDGEPAEYGQGGTPTTMRGGVKQFLSYLDITFRRDERTSRPRVNKPGSQLDREQNNADEYSYAR